MTDKYHKCYDFGYESFHDENPAILVGDWKEWNVVTEEWLRSLTYEDLLSDNVFELRWEKYFVAYPLSIDKEQAPIPQSRNSRPIRWVTSFYMERLDTPFTVATFCTIMKELGIADCPSADVNKSMRDMLDILPDL